MVARGWLQVGQQRTDCVFGAAQQRVLCAFGLQRMAWIAHVLVAEPERRDHHQSGRHRRDLGRVDPQHPALLQAAQQRSHRLLGAVQQVFELRLDPPVVRQQIVDVAVQKAVLPDSLEQTVHEEPRVFHIVHRIAGGQQCVQAGFVALEQPRDQHVLGRKVVVEVARADPEFGRDQRGRHVRLAETVEQLQRRLQNALDGAAWRLLGHGAGTWPSSSGGKNG